MKALTGILFFILAVFPHSIELTSPIRTREQTNNAWASTSGRHQASGGGADGVLLRHTPRCRICHNESDSERAPSYFYEENGQFLPIIPHNFDSVIKDGKLIGIIMDGFVRPIYNADHKIIIMSEDRNEERTVSLAFAEKLGVNQRVPKKYLRGLPRP